MVHLIPFFAQRFRPISSVVPGFRTDSEPQRQRNPWKRYRSAEEVVPGGDLDHHEFVRRSFVVIISIILCMMALTGTTYAYSTDITGFADIDGNVYSIDMYEDASGNNVLTRSIGPNEHLQFSTSKVIGGDYTAKVESGTLTYQTYFKIYTDFGSSARFGLDTTVEYHPGSSSGTVTFGDPDISVYHDSKKMDQDNLEGGITYQIVVKVPVNEGVFGTFSTFEDFRTAVTGFDGSIDIILTAERVA